MVREGAAAGPLILEGDGPKDWLGEGAGALEGKVVVSGELVPEIGNKSGPRLGEFEGAI